MLSLLHLRGAKILFYCPSKVFVSVEIVHVIIQAIRQSDVIELEAEAKDANVQIVKFPITKLKILLTILRVMKKAVFSHWKMLKRN